MRSYPKGGDKLSTPLQFRQQGDIYTIGGGEESACENWRNSGMMNTDCVHFLTSGYVLQGKLLGEAIYKAYTETVVSGTQTRMMHEPTPLEQKPYLSVRGF